MDQASRAKVADILGRMGNTGLEEFVVRNAAREIVKIADNWMAN